jgi:hypothetical protein
VASKRVSYDCWVKPDSGPLIVEVRGPDGVTVGWTNKDGAIAAAKREHTLYPNIHVVVRELDNYKPVRLVYDTSKTPPELT